MDHEDDHTILGLLAYTKLASVLSWAYGLHCQNWSLNNFYFYIL